MTEGSLDRVETARLVCARTTADHLEDLATLLQDPAVAKTLTATGAPASDAEVRANVEAKVEHWNKYGFGFWMVYDRATGAFVGRGGLQHTLAAGGNDVEIGWAIVPERWGEGLATELALASIDAGFGTLGLDELIAFTLIHNRASRRVMEKAGLSYEREFLHVGLPHALYRRVRC